MGNPHDCIIFLGRDGQPLPEWLQGPLERNLKRLSREFPSLNDPAVLQNLLDAVGQRVLEKTERGEQIHGVERFVARASQNAALDAVRGSDVFQRSRSVQRLPTPTVDPAQTALEPWWNKALTIQEDDLLVRHLWMGDRHEEIAQALSIPVSTVRNRYWRIIEKLRKLWNTQKGNGAHSSPGQTACARPSDTEVAEPIIETMRKDQCNG